MPIIVVFNKEPKLDTYGYETGEYEILVSHGHNTETDCVVILPANTFGEFRKNIHFDDEIGEYILNDNIH